MSTLIIISSSLLASTSALAGTAIVTGQVDRILINTYGWFGGCMARLSVDPQDALPACGSGWVTFSCTGDFTDQVTAYRALDQAQLALATDKQVVVVVDDSRRHNGYCFSLRIDILR